jgi:hypothetical protein
VIGYARVVGLNDIGYGHKGCCSRPLRCSLFMPLVVLEVAQANACRRRRTALSPLRNPDRKVYVCLFTGGIVSQMSICM